MQITYQETKADAKVRLRLRNPGPQASTLGGLFVAGTIAAASGLTLGGYWKAGAFFAFTLVLFLWLLLRRMPAAQAPAQRTIQLTEGYFEQTCNGDIHQGGWTTSLHLDSTNQHWILKRDQIAVLVIPKRAISDEAASGFESLVQRLVTSATSEEPREPVPMWNAAQHKPFNKVVTYIPTPDDFVSDTLQKYEPTAERPKKSVGRGCAILWLLGVSVLLLMLVRDEGWDNDFAIGAATLVVLVLAMLGGVVWQRQAAKRMVRQSPSFFGHEQLVALDYQGASVGSTRGFSFLPWSNLQGVMYGTKRMIGLLHVAGLLYVVPKHAFATEQELEDFMAFAAERIVEASEPIVDATLVEPIAESGNPYQPPSR